MRKILTYIAVAGIALMAFACKKTEPVEPAPAAPTEITLSGSTLSFVQHGGKLEVTVTAPTRPEVEGELPEWISKAKVGIYDKYQCKIAFTAQVNPAYTQRDGAVTIKAGELTATLALSQDGRVRPTPPEDTGLTTTLVTPDATANAQSLFAYLLGVYGKKTLSGVMANVNWNHDVADQIYGKTGHYPAINGYDFLHIYVTGDWVNYSDITPVTEWAQAGGLVSLMWHFNVPYNKDTTPAPDGSGVTCTPSETTFQAANALTEGTWENKWFYGQMDKVAEVLLKLQEAGIAALWRPFHEAAGNATRVTDWDGKAWFWWGADGSDTFKRLWVAMFDYFRQKGVRNLIWVWTTQNCNGDPSKYDMDIAWYPGDAYVDIVGRDLYGYTAAQNATEFTEIKTQYPSKMVTLAECGVDNGTSFAEVDAFWNAGAKWSWFSPWYGDSLPSDAWWTAALSSENVITREGIPTDLFE